MEFYISNSSDKPIYEQIMTQIKSQILSGALKEGDALPSIRVLAPGIGVSALLQQSEPTTNWNMQGCFIR